MEKARKGTAILLMAFTVLSFAACEEWGKADPPAGNDATPNLEEMGNIITFEEDAFDPTSMNYFAFQEGDVPEVTDDDDEERGKVLHISGGYARLFNPIPMSGKKAQNGVSLTFWIKQQAQAEALAADEGSEQPEGNDLTGALFSFQNENGTQRMFFTANGWLSYDAVDGEYEVNNPENVKTGMLDGAGQWHYVALTVRNDGYDVFVDGKKRINEMVTNFDFSRIVQFMANTPYIYIGEGSGTEADVKPEFWIDDIRIYRNCIGSAQQAIPSAGTGPGDTFEYLVGDPIFTVGAEDNSAAWWTAFSNYFRMPAECTMKFKFTNYTSGANNWNNWCFCLSTDADRNGEGYAEYIVLRSDLYGWGDSYNADGWSSEGYDDWDAFKVDMNEAEVTVTVRREGPKVTVQAVAMAKNGHVYKETITANCGDGTQVVRGFFIMDGSHIVFDPNETSALNPMTVSKTSIGAEDCSAAWWTEFSDYFQIPAGENLHLQFENHTSGDGNWNNWNICICTDADRNGEGYDEYLVLRSDYYGWGNSYSAGTWSNEGYPADDDGWGEFRKDMEGATVVIDVQRNGASVTVTAVATAKNGKVYKESFVADCGDGTQTIRAFLIVDASHLKMDSSSCYLYTPLFK